MKHLLLILSFFISQVVMAETYYVTFIKGAVKVSGAAKNIAVGDKLSDKDQLVFIDKSSKISCISPAKGRFDISAEKSKQNAKKEWVAVLTDLLVPSYGGKQLSTRALGDQNDAETLFKSNHPENKVLLVEDFPVEVSAGTPIDNNNFFFLQYVVNGKTMVKKVQSKGNALVFSRNILVGTAGEVLPQESVTAVSLCYQQKSSAGATSKVIAKFNPVFVAKADFDAEVTVLKKYLSAQSQEKAANELYNHFYGNYGFINTGLFRKMIK